MPEVPAAPGPSNPIYFVLAIIIALFILWLYTGGPSRYEEAHPEVPPPTAQEIGVPAPQLAPAAPQ